MDFFGLFGGDDAEKDAFDAARCSDNVMREPSENDGEQLFLDQPDASDVEEEYADDSGEDFAFARESSDAVPDGPGHARDANLAFLNDFLTALSSVCTSSSSSGSASRSESSSASVSTSSSSTSYGGSRRASPLSAEKPLELEDLVDVVPLAVEYAPVQRKLALNRQYFQCLSDVLLRLDDFDRKTTAFHQQLRCILEESALPYTTRRQAVQAGASALSSPAPFAPHPPTLSLASSDDEWTALLLLPMVGEQRAQAVRRLKLQWLRRQVRATLGSSALRFDAKPQASGAVGKDAASGDTASIARAASRRLLSALNMSWTSVDKRAVIDELLQQLQRALLDRACSECSDDLDAMTARLQALEDTLPACLLLDNIESDPAALLSDDSATSDSSRLLLPADALDLSSTSLSPINWLRVSKAVQGRHSVRQCQRLWLHDLVPQLRAQLAGGTQMQSSSPPFSAAELNVLRRAVRTRMPWPELARLLPGRALDECVVAFRTFIHDELQLYKSQCSDADGSHHDAQTPTDASRTPKATERRWTPAEDCRLRTVVQDTLQGVVLDWARVSALFSGRTAVQCQLRYQRALRPAICKGKWTKQEDEALMNAVARSQTVESNSKSDVHHECGDEGSGAEKMPSEGDDQVTINNSQVAIDDDQVAINDTPAAGMGRKKPHDFSIPWAVVAKDVPTRTDVQCRERWVNVLNPQRDRAKWTQAEDEVLRGAVIALGPKWSLISRQHFQGRRTDNDCLRRFRRLTLSSAHAASQADPGTEPPAPATRVPARRGRKRKAMQHGGESRANLPTTDGPQRLGSQPGRG